MAGGARLVTKARFTKAQSQTDRVFNLQRQETRAGEHLAGAGLRSTTWYGARTSAWSDATLHDLRAKVGAAHFGAAAGRGISLGFFTIRSIGADPMFEQI